MSTIDEIKARIDIVDLVGESVQLRKSGKNYLGFCPFHANTRTPAFVVFPDTGTWRCFGECNEGGDIFKFVMKKEGLDFPEALKLLAQKAGVVLRKPTPQEQEEEEIHERLRILLEDAVAYYRHHLFNTKAGEPVLAYLIEKRGLTEETIETFGLGYAPQGWENAIKHFLGKGFTKADLIGAGLVSEREDGKIYDRFRKRIMIPIRDASGRMAGFGARVVDPNDQPKFLNSPQTPLFDKSKLLYGLDRARKAIRQAEKVVIVEGYFDVIAPHQHGFQNVVSPMGTALTPQQLRLLKRYSSNIILAMDSDAAGDKAALRGIETARQNLDRKVETVFDARGLLQHEARLQADIRITTLPEGLDPDDIVNRNPEDWEALINNAKPIVIYMMETLTKGENLNDPKVKSKIAETILPFIEDVPNAVERDTYIQRLARLLHVDERTLLAARSKPPLRRRRAVTRRQQVKREETIIPEAPIVTGDAREVYCIGVLLRQPELIYHLNRKLREAGLEKITQQDFQDSDLQHIFRLIEKSLTQDETEPLDYVLNNLPLSIMQVADVLLQRTEGFDTEGKDILIDLIRAIIKLREDNLKQQLAYLRFLQEEEQEQGEKQSLQHHQAINQYILMLNRLHRAQERFTSKERLA